MVNHMDSTLPHVFRAYDIRGLSPDELDAPFARCLARAVITVYSPRKVLIGRDMRLTSSLLQSAFVDELCSYGVDVIDIGLCTTPMFNVLVGLSKGGVDLGVMITASHNPGKYNGFKMIRGDMLPIGQGSGMEELARAFAGEKTEDGRWKMEGGVKERGTVVKDETGLARYADHILKLADLPPEMPKMKIAIDAGNGMAGAVLPELLRRLPWLEVNSLYFEPNGTFPNHEANPLKHETLRDLQDLVRREACALGVAFDGDADRVGLVDEKGELVSGDLVLALVSQEILRNQPDGLVLYDVRCSWAVPEAIAKAGGRPKMCRVGHAYIKRQMREENAVFAGEVSMHYYFHNLFNVESGDLLFLLILRRLAQSGVSLSSLWRPLLRYVHSGEISFSVRDKAAVIQNIRGKYAASAKSISELDGIRFEFEDWWFSLRESNTEPLVRLNVESRTKEMTERKVNELANIINQP